MNEGHFDLRTWIRRHRRESVAILATLVVTALAGPAVAQRLIGGDEGGPPVITASEARLAASYDTSWGKTARLWTATLADGRTCEISRLDDTGTSGEFDTKGLVVCGTGTRPVTRPVRVGLDWYANSKGGFDVLVTGKVKPGLGAIKVSVEGKETKSVAVGTGGYFFAELAPSDDRYALSPADPAPELVVRGQSGAPLGRVSLAEFLLGAPAAG